MKTKNIFEAPGKKQIGQDFKPAPDKIETNFGTLKFELEAFPTEESIGKIYDEMDLQRATQAYMDFYPALSVYAIVKSQIRDFGFKTSSDIAVAADPGWKPSEPFLTGNNSTVYHSTVDVTISYFASLEMGYYLAYAAGGMLILLALFRDAITGKPKLNT